jgi:hypothetical protein
MTRHRIAHIGENRNPESPENRSQTRPFLEKRLLQACTSAALVNSLVVLHGRLYISAILIGFEERRRQTAPVCRYLNSEARGSRMKVEVGAYG